MNRILQYSGQHYAAMFNAGREVQQSVNQGPMLSYPTQGQRKRPKWWPWFIGFVIGWLTHAVAFSADPASEVRAAVLHAKTLPAEVALGARYLSLYGIPSEDRDEAAKVLSYAVNAVSRTRAITQPKFISDTLAVVYIGYYAPAADEFAQWYSAWEKLGESDPYFHIKTQVSIDIHRLGKSISTVTVDGGWVNIAAAQQLKLCTGSNAPVLRADYFIANALQSPRYYEFAGVPPNASDFVKSLGLQLDVIDKLRANAGANLLISNVTQKPRRVIWSQSPIGGYYETLDVQQVDAERDPVRRPVTSGTLQTKFDATEIFAMAPNGLWRVALYDAKGKQQQTVPDRIAKDTSDPHGDGIVTPLVSCIRCHTEGGLKSFSDDQVKLLAKSVLQSYDANIVQRALEFYDDARLARQMRFDRETYEVSCLRATDLRKPGETTCQGLSSAQLAEALAKVVRNFSYLPVSTEQAALECGVDVTEFKAAIRITHDPILLTLLEGRGVLRDQWNSSFSEAALACAVRRAR